MDYPCTVKWLNRERLTVYPKIFLALYACFGAFLIISAAVSGNGLTDFLGRPLGSRFPLLGGILPGPRPETLGAVSIISKSSGSPGSVFEWFHHCLALSNTYLLLNSCRWHSLSRRWQSGW